MNQKVKEMEPTNYISNGNIASFTYVPPRGAELFEAKVKKLIAARLELEKKSVETLKKQ